MARRTMGGLLAAALLLGLLSVVPMVADASSAGRDGDASAAASPTLDASGAPFDPQPLVLLLVAGLIGGMGVLAREPVPERSHSRR
jgi:hypothetical protein